MDRSLHKGAQFLKIAEMLKTMIVYILMNYGKAGFNPLSSIEICLFQTGWKFLKQRPDSTGFLFSGRGKELWNQIFSLAPKG
jgi:hypothetical protein